MKRAIELICPWGGIVFAILFFVGFVGIARFVPPLSPANTAAQTPTIYRDRTNAIRPGLLLCYIGTMFFLAFGRHCGADPSNQRGRADHHVFPDLKLCVGRPSDHPPDHLLLDRCVSAGHLVGTGIHQVDQ